MSQPEPYKVILTGGNVRTLSPRDGTSRSPERLLLGGTEGIRLYTSLQLRGQGRQSRHGRLLLSKESQISSLGISCSSICGKMQEFWIIEVISFIRISAICGQHPALLISHIPTPQLISELPWGVGASAGSQAMGSPFASPHSPLEA